MLTSFLFRWINSSFLRRKDERSLSLLLSRSDKTPSNQSLSYVVQMARISEQSLHVWMLLKELLTKVVHSNTQISNKQFLKQPSDPNYYGYTRADLSNGFLSAVRLIVIPVLNPDGYNYARTADRLWKKNRAPTGNLNCKVFVLELLMLFIPRSGYKFGAKQSLRACCHLEWVFFWLRWLGFSFWERTSWSLRIPFA